MVLSLTPKHKVFKNRTLGAALSVAGGVITGGLSRGVPSGHYWAERHILGSLTEAESSIMWDGERGSEGKEERPGRRSEE